jgi:hypothetical protein
LALKFLDESFGLITDLFPFPSILDAGYPFFELPLAYVLCDVILPSVLVSSVYNLLLVFFCTRFRLHPFNRPVPFLR